MNANSQVRSTDLLRSHPLVGYALGLVATGAATAAVAMLEAHAGLREPGMVYLPAVLVTAVAAGLGPSLLASIASFAAYDWFFTVPYRRLTMDDPQDIVSVFVFLLVAVLTSHLMSRVRQEGAAALEREARTSALYAFTRELAAAVRLDDLLAIVVRHVGERFGADAVVLMPADGGLVARAAFPPGADVPDHELDAASVAWSQGRSAPLAILSAAGGRWIHVSLGTIRGEVAILAMKLRGEPRLPADDERLLDAFTQQAGVAIERCLADPAHAAPSPEAVTSATTMARLRALEQRIDRMHQDLTGMKGLAHEIVEASRRSSAA